MPPTDDQTRLIAAIRDHLNERGMSQRQFGAEVGALEGAGPNGYPQSSVGEWLAGRVYLAPPRVFCIERVLGLVPGTLSKLDGYVPTATAATPTTVEEALAADPDITADQATMIEAGVVAMRNQTRQRRSSRSRR